MYSVMYPILLHRVILNFDKKNGFKHEFLIFLPHTTKNNFTGYYLPNIRQNGVITENNMYPILMHVHCINQFVCLTNKKNYKIFSRIRFTLVDGKDDL